MATLYDLNLKPLRSFPTVISAKKYKKEFIKDFVKAEKIKGGDMTFWKWYLERHMRIK